MLAAFSFRFSRVQRMFEVVANWRKTDLSFSDRPGLLQFALSLESDCYMFVKAIIILQTLNLTYLILGTKMHHQMML